MNTFPQTDGLSYADFYQNDLLDNYDLFHPLSARDMVEGEWGFFNANVFNADQNAENCDAFNTRASPKEEHVFRFPDLNQKDNLVITENERNLENSGIGSKMNFDEKHANTTLALDKVKNYGEEPDRKLEVMAHMLQPLRKAQSTGQSKVVRRDVVNKTIFRIIRRYFLNLLEKAVPDYRIQKKANLMNMLTSFAEFLFPGTENSTKIAEVMSALMFRRELLLAKSELTKDADLKVFLDIQSKYTHKLLLPALENKHFKVMFEYFLAHGIEFLNNDENVINNASTYKLEFGKIRSLYQTLSQIV